MLSQPYTSSNNRSSGPMAQRIPDPVVPLTISQHAQNIFRTPTPRSEPTPAVSSGPMAQESTKKDKRVRPHIQVRLPGGALDVERQIANWRVERKAAPKVAEAIRLLAAIDSGNLEYVRENYPLMVAALQSRQKRRPTPSSDSYSYKEREKESDEEKKVEPAIEELAEAIDTITGRDRRLNRDVYTLANELHASNYTANDVTRWYEKCWPKDWRAQKGERPTLKLTREEIGQVRNLPPDEPATPEQSDSPYLQDEYFRRAADPVPIPEDKPMWPPEWCKVDGRTRNSWDNAVDRIRWHISKEHYELEMRRAKPVHIEGDPRKKATLFVGVPDRRCKEVIEELIPLDALSRWVNDYYDQGSLQKSPLPINLEFVIKGDPIPLRGKSQPCA